MVLGLDSWNTTTVKIYKENKEPKSHNFVFKYNQQFGRKTKLTLIVGFPWHFLN